MHLLVRRGRDAEDDIAGKVTIAFRLRQTARRVDLNFVEELLNLFVVPHCSPRRRFARVYPRECARDVPRETLNRRWHQEGVPRPIALSGKRARPSLTKFPPALAGLLRPPTAGPHCPRLSNCRQWNSERTMTKALQDVFKEAAKLPEAEQEQLAATIRAELEAEASWEARLASSRTALDRLADEALAEHRSGKSQPLNPTKI